MSRENRPKFIELFAGAGMLSQAFILEGFAPLLAFEIDSDSVATYRQNIGDHIVKADVRSVSPEACDVLIAGPPCQGFSTLNRHRKEDSRRFLVMEVARWARVAKPSLVVVENVAPFAATEECAALARSLRSQNYSISVRTCDATMAGTAQKRKRTFLIASREKDIELNFDVSAEPKTIRKAWRKLPERRKDPLGAAPQPSKLALDRMRRVPEGGDRRDLMNASSLELPRSWKRLAVNDNSGVWGRMRWDAPAPTLRTCFQNPSKGRYIHPRLNRVITLREGARLQDIPDCWRFVGTRTSVCRQIGNGVPILLGRMVARECSKLLNI
jgi:DNA (cytosine-5)-methyltransferase 1